MANAGVIWRASAALILSFVVTGLATVVPQLYFQEHAEADKHRLLPAALLLGTFGAIAAVKVAGRHSAGRGPSARWIALLVGLTSIAFAAMLHATAPVLFVVVLCIVRVLANYAGLLADARCTQDAGRDLRELNDRAVNGFRVLGMLLAPLILAAAIAAPGPVSLVTLALGAIGAVGLVLSEVPSAARAALSDTTEEAPPLDLSDRFFLGYALCTYAALYVFAAKLIYLLTDWGIPRPELTGGALIFLFQLSTLLAAALGPRLGARGLGERTRLLASPLTLAAGVGLAMMKPVPLLPWMTGITVIMGAGFGVFLAGLRDRVSRAVIEEGKTAFLPISHNLANYGSLLAFGTLLISAQLDGGGVHAASATLGATAAWALAGIPVLFAAFRQPATAPLSGGRA